ncbi:MAG: carbon-nitrogen hydrolase family protein [Verrucomicrobiales bacterium]
MAQVHVIGGDLQSNLLRAARAVEAAAAAGADIVILPEAMDLGWAHHSAELLAEPVPDGSTVEHLSDLAVDHAIYICAGLTERAGDHIYNSAVLIDRRGRLLIKHRKINELEFARKIYHTGHGTEVCTTEFGKVGIMICADAFADGLHVSREIGRKGARLILSPCAWAVPADFDDETLSYGQLWIDSYAPVAIEFNLWIAGVSSVGKIRSGEWAGHHCIGSSMLVNPAGKIEARAPFGRAAESLTMVEIPRE